MSLLRKERYTVRPLELALWSVLLVMVAVSFFDNGWLTSLDRGLWFDEALTTFFIAQSWAGLIDLVTSFEANMALYYGLLKLWSAVAGSEVVLRLFSMVVFAGGVAILANGVRRYIGVRTAFAAAVLIIGHFFLIRYSVEVRGYALAFLGVAMLWYCWLRAVSDASPLWWWAYTAVGFVALHFHFFVALAVFTLGMAALIVFPRRISFKQWFMSHAIIGFSFLPIAMFVLFQEKGQLSWIEEPGFRALLDTAFMYSGAAAEAPEWIRHSLLIGFTFLVGGGSLAAVLRGNEDSGAIRHPLLISAISLSTVPVILAFLVSQIEPSFSGRFFVPFVPFFLVWAAVVSEPVFRYWLLPLVAGLSVLFAISASAYTDRDIVSWKDANRKMLMECEGNAGALFMTPNSQAVFRFYQANLDSKASCNWSIYPYTVAPANYLRKPDEFPTDLGDLSGLDEMWVFITHSFEDEDEMRDRYWDQLNQRFQACTKSNGQQAIQLYRCR